MSNTELFQSFSTALTVSSFFIKSLLFAFQRVQPLRKVGGFYSGVLVDGCPVFDSVVLLRIRVFWFVWIKILVSLNVSC